ncbi:hypothetical protein MKY59_20845 [Paenibacillus sp. FSL W8-0426]|uniref:hypothetical protein n=1 Tax=Paenibacillus sp. FSL W8-0426 TaxID=2921714 RepID=UPI0030D95DF0
MNTVQIKIVAPFKAKDKTRFVPGETYKARRISMKIFDYSTPYQIVEGPHSGKEIPFKCAVELKPERTYTQQQYDEIVAQRDEALAQRDASFADLAKHGQTIVELQEDRVALLRTIERATAHNEMSALPGEVVHALEAFKRNGDDWDTVIRWMTKPYQCDIAFREAIYVIRNYADENGWKLINGMVNGYVVEPQKEETTGIARIALSWWKERNIEASESDMQSLVDRLNSQIAERQTV